MKRLKVPSVKIRHYFKGIIIPYNLPNKKCIFHKREGLPIKVSVESFLDIIIQCRHEVNHNFRIPIESLIEWKIINGVNDGAFKHGYGLRSKYSDTNNETCVIYYPGIRGNKDDYKDKDIPISIRISSNKIDDSIEYFSANNGYENNHTPLIEDNATQLLILHLKQKNGFLNKMYYESSITVRQTAQRELEFSKNQIITNMENEDYTYPYDKNRNTFSVENKCVSNCNECKLRITFQFPDGYSVTNQIKMAMDTNRFLSSEYIKISNSVSKYLCGTDRPNIDFDLNNNNESVDKFRINNCPVIKTKETFWTSTAGPFPCGDNDNSIIYYSLNEKELSKSPITLKLFERNLYKQNGDKFADIIDERKFWIVRKAIMGG